MSDKTLFPWRAPLSADWVTRWKSVDAIARTLGSVLKYREDHDVAIEAGLAWVSGA